MTLDLIGTASYRANQIKILRAEQEAGAVRLDRGHLLVRERVCPQQPGPGDCPWDTALSGLSEPRGDSQGALRLS